MHRDLSTDEYPEKSSDGFVAIVAASPEAPTMRPPDQTSRLKVPNTRIDSFLSLARHWNAFIANAAQSSRRQATNATDATANTGGGVGVDSRMLAYAGVCWRMLAYACVCSRMLALGHRTQKPVFSYIESSCE